MLRTEVVGKPLRIHLELTLKNDHKRDVHQVSLKPSLQPFLSLKDISSYYMMSL